MAVGIGPVSFKPNMCVFRDGATGLGIPTSLNRVREMAGYMLLL
jgi:hypothetical protein